MRDTNGKCLETFDVSIPIKSQAMQLSILACVEDVDLITQSVCVAQLPISLNQTGQSKLEETLRGFIITDPN